MIETHPNFVGGYRKDYREINYDGEKAIQSDAGQKSSSDNGPGFGRCSGSSPGVRQGDREITGSMLGVHRKMIERLVGSSPEDVRKFAGSSKNRLTCRRTRTIVIVS
ncbi:hypothetical protein BHE74_00005286 [Ensete ventricosum]|nr:hypothetical protein BHE74_00005286 [Ensete ventricosum]